MLSYCLGCRENTKNIILQVSKATNGGIILCGDKKSKFIKKQEANGLLNDLAIKKRLSKAPVLRDILF